ncbi:MAG: ADOP family duplicated permease [Gemmatimonadales bacterium]
MPPSADALLQDLRQTARSLRRDPHFTLFGAVVFAIGIGATAAAWTALRTVVLDPLPYPGPDRLMMIWSNWPEQGVTRMASAGGDFRLYQREATRFEGVAAVGSLIQNLTGGERPEQVTVGWVSRNFFLVMGVRPVLGRDFQPDEPPTSLLLGYGLWQRDFAGDPDVLGRTVRLGGRPFTVIGVTPPDFRLHLAPDAGIATAIDVWRPPDEAGDPDRWVTSDVQNSQLRLVGRLKPGATLDQARQEMRRIASDLRDRFRDHAAVGFDVSVEPLVEEVAGQVRPFFVLLQAAALLVFLLACANVGSLFLVRGQRRLGEMRTRLTLGARRTRILRLVLLEGLGVGLLGGLLGLGLAGGILSGVRALRLTAIPRLEGVTLGVATVHAVVLASVLAGLLAGGWSAVQVGRIRLAEGTGLRGGGAATVRKGLVVLEVALATMLLAGSLVLARSAGKLRQADPGLDVANLLTFGVNLPGTRYDAPVETADFIERLEGGLEGRPGIEAVGATWPLPLEGQLWADNYRTAASRADEEAPFADLRLASPGLLGAMGLRLLEGRNLTGGDSLSVLVDEQLAKDEWPGQSAVGQTVWIVSERRPFTVVGVVADVRHPRLRTYASHTIYLPMTHSSWTDWEIFVTVRTSGDPLRVVPVVREVLGSLDPELPMGKVRTMRGYLDDRLAPSRLSGWISGSFAAAGLLLAMVGLYGVISYSVQARRHELAVRMSLGAEPRSIRALVMRNGSGLVGLGILLGLAGALAGAGLLSTLLYGVGPRDPLAYGAAVLTSLVVGLAATWIPAVRASREDPAGVLRA